MAKKRTLLPFYGKASQSHDQLAARLLKVGDLKGAALAREKAKSIQRKRAEAKGWEIR
jgi:hypothetical protein